MRVLSGSVQAKSHPARLAILIPVFNDWESLEHLLGELSSLGSLPDEMVFVVVDDGSTQQAPLVRLQSCAGGTPTHVVKMGTNLGHQRAIATGLVAIAEADLAECVLVMDADGEDSPQDTVKLWEHHVSHPEAVVVAQRRGRSETLPFRFFYSLYRVLFRWLTGKKLDFGNYSLVNGGTLRRLIFMPELWNHYPATIMKSRCEILRVPLRREPRLAGHSSMNFIALVNHGMAGISVFADTAFARLLVLAFSAISALAATITGGVVYRLVSDSPLPGWFALVTTAALIALLQVVVALTVIAFLNLSLRSQPRLPPVDVAAAYVSGTNVLGID